MITSRRIRIALSVVSAVLIVLGVIFFARQDLGTADQVASVASFFVGLVALALSLWSFLTSRASRSNEIAESEGSTPAGSTPSGSTSGLPFNINIRDTEVVQIGPKARAVVHKTVHIPTGSPAPRREKERDARPASSQPDV